VGATNKAMVCAQTMALLVAPTMALDLIQKHTSGYFDTVHPAYGAPAGFPCISWIVALAAVCVISSYVLILFSIFIGLGLALMFSVGDVFATYDAVLLSTPPMEWLRAGVVAALLGAVCGLSVALHAWPGTKLSNSTGDSPTHTHRLSLRVTLVCSVVVAIAGIAMNGVISLFDRPLL